MRKRTRERLPTLTTFEKEPQGEWVVGTKKLLAISAAALPLLCACAPHAVESFVVYDARFAHDDFAALAGREPVRYGSIGGAIAVHRLQAGSFWIIAYREHTGSALLGGADTQQFMKVTMEFRGEGKPQGTYALGAPTLRVRYSSGSSLGGGRRGCYAEVHSGNVLLTWSAREQFQVSALMSIGTDYFCTKDAASQSTELRITGSGLI